MRTITEAVSISQNMSLGLSLVESFVKVEIVIISGLISVRNQGIMSLMGRTNQHWKNKRLT